MIPDQFWKEIEPFENKIVLVSGGKDSTVTALEFHRKKIQCYYLHNDTGLTMKESRATLDKLYEHTKGNVIDFIKVKAQDYLNALVSKKPNYPYPTVKLVLNNAFENLQRVQETMENKGRYDRKLFLCCNRLKKQPSNWYLRENKSRFLPEKTVLIMSIAAHRKESKQRRIRLAEIRKQESFLRFHKSNGLWYAYPFRDLFKEQLITDYLINNDFGDVISSGCAICPILLLFRMFDKDPKRYVKSKKYFLKNFENVQFCSRLDHTLDEFIQEVA